MLIELFAFFGIFALIMIFLAEWKNHASIGIFASIFIVLLGLWIFSNSIQYVDSNSKTVNATSGGEFGGFLTPSSGYAALSNGTLNNLNYTRAMDTEYWTILENLSTPGFDIFFNITGIPNSNFVDLNITGKYTGIAADEVSLFFWNGSNWNFYYDIEPSNSDTSYFVPSIPRAQYVFNGTLEARIIHTTAGKANDVIDLDRIALTPQGSSATNNAQNEIITPHYVDLEWPFSGIILFKHLMGILLIFSGLYGGFTYVLRMGAKAQG